MAATVDGEAVYLDQVERELSAAVGSRTVDPQTRPDLLALVLRQLIQRRLILGWLASTGQVASDQDVELAVQRLRRALTPQGQTLSQYCQARGFDEQELRQTLRWRLSWERLLSRHLTEENLRKYFEQHRRDWDGTRLRVAHILWKVATVDDPSRLAPALAAAQRVREQITGGQLAFAAAAREQSQAPSAAQGGDIGFISRHEPMPEAFSRAAFSLQPGEVSEPIVTVFGVHLITCLEVEAGHKNWSDERAALEKAAARYLFRWAADRQRGKAVIRWTGVIPETSRSEADLQAVLDAR